MPAACTAFANGRLIARGSAAAIAPAVKEAYDDGAPSLLVFDDASGRLVEMDLRGSVDETVARLQDGYGHRPPARGRPKLGVTAREVTLLPGHWDWLASQPGGASATLRRLVEQARKAGDDEVRKAGDAAYRVMLALAGNLADFEEASRAFFAKDYDQFARIADHWPSDIRAYVSEHVARLRALSQA